jgi:hypothetical protein
MAVFFEVLVAVNVEDIGGLTGADEAVSDFGLHVEFYGRARFGTFNSELLLYLSPAAQNASKEDHKSA